MGGNLKIVSALMCRGAAFWAMLLSALAVLNAAMFTAVAADPYICADDWHFLSKVIRPWFEGTFRWSNLYILRGPSDHSLPVQKLTALLSAIWFNLDYRVYSVLGFASALCFLWLVQGLFSRSSPDMAAKRKYLCSACLAIVFFSMNSTISYSWPLVTMGFLNGFWVLAFFAILDGHVRSGRPGIIACGLSAMACLAFADDLGILAVCSGSIVLAIGVATGSRERRRGFISMFLALVAVTLIFALWRHGVVTYSNRHYLTPGKVESLFYFVMHPGTTLAGLFMAMANSLLHIVYYHHIGKDVARNVQLILGGAVFVLHLCAWSIYIKKRQYERSLVPALLVVISYLIFLGILAYRLPAGGPQIFDMPRYIRNYQFGVIGVLWMLLLGLPERWPAELSGKIRTAAVGVAVLMVVSTSAYADIAAWKIVKYIERWQMRHAEFLVELASNSNLGCPSFYSICKYRPEQRAEMLKFLRQNQLNVFSTHLRPSS